MKAAAKSSATEHPEQDREQREDNIPQGGNRDGNHDDDVEKRGKKTIQLGVGDELDVGPANEA